MLFVAEKKPPQELNLKCQPNQNNLENTTMEQVLHACVSKCFSLVCLVCQETIWEAFKIFWDRLPEQEEYQSWMSQCQEGTVTAQYIGSYFSQSEEHQALVKKVSG